MRARAGRVSENPHLTAIFGDGSSRVLRIRRPGGTAVRVRTLIERSERAIAIRIARLLLAKASPFWRGAVARIATDGEHIARAVVSTNITAWVDHFLNAALSGTRLQADGGASIDVMCIMTSSSRSVRNAQKHNRCYAALGGTCNRNGSTSEGAHEHKYTIYGLRGSFIVAVKGMIERYPI